MEKQKITEEMGVQKQWYEQARNETAQTLPEFIRHLTEDYEHDYGTICHACAAASIAAASAINHSGCGGITGFQAGAVMWEFIQHWMDFDGPLKLLKYENMLYPQYDYHFEKTISNDTWQWLMDQAHKKIESHDPITHPDVLSHWHSIADGKIPFGYTLSEE